MPHFATAMPGTAPAPPGRASRPTCRLTAVVPGQRLALAGRLDVTAAADARLALTEAVAGGAGELVLDLSRLDAVDATGLGVLVGAHRNAGRAGRTLVLLDVPAPVSRLLFLTRLHRVLRIASSA